MNVRIAVPVVFIFSFALYSCKCSTDNSKLSDKSPESSCQARISKQIKQREFPMVNIPTFYADDNEKQEYLTSHFWDAFFCEPDSTSAETSLITNDKSLTIFGVDSLEIEKAFVIYTGLLQKQKVEKARGSIAAFFKEIEKYKRDDNYSEIFDFFADLTAKYLYDPSSPYRNEEVYHAFLHCLIHSDISIKEDLREGFRYDYKMCSINRIGEKARNFSFVDNKGNEQNLYSIKSKYILLLFSNPECKQCSEVIENLKEIEPYLAKNKLTIINVYIDYEFDKWKKASSYYPQNWINAYEHLHRIREKQTYNIRAIPSLYLIDREKKVLMKDATIDSVINQLSALNIIE